jgi:hypothetical protein
MGLFQPTRLLLPAIGEARPPSTESAAADERVHAQPASTDRTQPVLLEAVKAKLRGSPKAGKASLLRPQKRFPSGRTGVTLGGSENKSLKRTKASSVDSLESRAWPASTAPFLLATPAGWLGGRVTVKIKKTSLLRPQKQFTSGPVLIATRTRDVNSQLTENKLDHIFYSQQNCRFLKKKRKVKNGRKLPDERAAKVTSCGPGQAPQHRKNTSKRSCPTQGNEKYHRVQRFSPQPPRETIARFGRLTPPAEAL